jgi:hypothetical protein
MIFGLDAIARSIDGDGATLAIARFARLAAVAGLTVGVVVVSLDGIGSKYIADAWAAAPPGEAAIALRLVVAEQTLNFALAALFNILFAGVTYLLYGLAVARCTNYPRWSGWIVVVAAIGSIAVGVIQAAVGHSTNLTRTMTIGFPTVITIWTAVMGVVLRSRSAPAKAVR